MTIELTEKKLKLVGELAVFHERSGMQPAAARIIALLIVSDEPELTFEEIYETLNMSKSATSNALNFLLNTERIEYVTRLGERKRYFKVKLKNIKESITRFLSGMDTFNNVLKRILDQRPVGTREFNNNLEELTRFQDFLQQELPLLIQKWESGNK